MRSVSAGDQGRSNDVGISRELPRKKKLDQAVKQNVEIAVRRLSRVPDLRRRIRAGEIKVVGAIYDMHTSQVELLQ